MKLHVVGWCLLSCAAVVHAEPKSLQSSWEYAVPNGLPQTIAVDDAGRPALYLAAKNGGLIVLESADKKAPKQIAHVPVRRLGGLDAMNVIAVRNRLYVALGDFFNAGGSPSGLAVLDVAKPADPQVLGLWTSEEKLNGCAAVTVRGDYAYLGAMRFGVIVLNVKDPARIRRAGSVLPDPDFPLKNPGKTQHPNARGFAWSDRLLYTAYDAGGLRVLDTADPTAPKEIGRYVNEGMGKKQQAFNNLIIDGKTAYVAVDYAGLEVLDVADPKKIRRIAWWNPWEAHTLKNLWLNSAGHTNQIAFDSVRKRVYLSAGDSELVVLDVADRTQPKLIARHGEPKDGRGAWGVTRPPNGPAYLTYITAVVPFSGKWSGIKAVAD